MYRFRRSGSSSQIGAAACRTVGGGGGGGGGTLVESVEDAAGASAGAALALPVSGAGAGAVASGLVAVSENEVPFRRRPHFGHHGAPAERVPQRGHSTVVACPDVAGMSRPQDPNSRRAARANITEEQNRCGPRSPRSAPGRRGCAVPQARVSAALRARVDATSAGPTASSAAASEKQSVTRVLRPSGPETSVPAPGADHSAGR